MKQKNKKTRKKPQQRRDEPALQTGLAKTARSLPVRQRLPPGRARIAGLAGLRRAAFVTLSIADPPAKPCDGGIFGGLYALPEMCSRKKEQNQTKAAPRLRFCAGASLASACAKAWP